MQECPRRVHSSRSLADLVPFIEILNELKFGFNFVPFQNRHDKTGPGLRLFRINDANESRTMAAILQEPIPFHRYGTNRNQKKN